MIYRNNLLLCLVALFLSTQLNAQVPAYVPTDSLVGFWDFNGNVNNSLVSGVSLSPGGNVNYAIDRNGFANSSLNNGGAYKTSIDGFNATNAFTIGGWVAPFLVTYSSYPSNFIGYFYKMDYEVQQQFGPPSVGTHTQFAFLSDYISIAPGITGQGPDYGKLYFQTVIGGITRILKSSANYNSNYWYHVMVSYDQSYLRLYVNGDCTDSLAVTGNLDYSNATGNNEWVGFTAYVNHDVWQSIESRTTLDKMGFWRRALTACEIDSLYHESNPCGGAGNPTNILEQSVENIMIYPNPIQNYLTIAGIEKSSNYQVVDITGKVVLQGKLYGSNNQISIEELVNGIYFLKIEGYKTQKIVVKH
jgi:hypothetical protein